MTTFKNEISTLKPRALRGVALVTGASRGIGLALCESLAAEGYAVIPTFRSLLSSVPSEIHPAFFQHENILTPLHLDVTNKHSITELDELLKKTGVKIDLLVHNAGVLTSSRDSNALQLQLAEVRHVFETNLFGLIETNHALWPHLSQNALVAMLSSIMSHVSREDYTYSAYRLSKHCVSQFARQVALQCKAENKNHTILSLHPGSVKTDMNPFGKITIEDCVKNVVKLFSLKMRPLLQKSNGSFWSFDESKNEWAAL